MAVNTDELIHTKIWREECEEHPFQASACYCAGFDVFGELIEKINFIDFLYLLFKLDPPTSKQRKLLNILSIALANPGPRDLSVRAAMSAAVGGSTAAASLMAALSVGAGKHNGAREVFLCARLWSRLETSLDSWQRALARREFEEDVPEVWPAMEHAPGFDPHANCTSRPNLQLLESLSKEYSDGALGFLKSNRHTLEATAGCPLGLTGIAAAALIDIGFNDEQAEMLFMLMRLPGAAAHAIEQREYGWRQYPFFSKSLVLNTPSEATSGQGNER